MSHLPSANCDTLSSTNGTSGAGEIPVYLKLPFHQTLTPWLYAICDGLHTTVVIHSNNCCYRGSSSCAIDMNASTSNNGFAVNPSASPSHRHHRQPLVKQYSTPITLITMPPCTCTLKRQDHLQICRRPMTMKRTPQMMATLLLGIIGHASRCYIFDNTPVVATVYCTAAIFCRSD